MSDPNKLNFFTQYGQTLLAEPLSDYSKKDEQHPFTDMPQLAHLTDILIRKLNHHAIIDVDYPEMLDLAFLNALLSHLLQTKRASLPETEIIFFRHIPRIETSAQPQIKNDFTQFIAQLEQNHQQKIVVLTSLTLLPFTSELNHDAFLATQFESIMRHPKVRFIFLTRNELQKIEKIKSSKKFQHHFSLQYIEVMDETLILFILKQYREKLENYHNIGIPEELLLQAYFLANRYLSTDQALQHTVQLLDSAAARTTMLHEVDSTKKPILTYATLTSVLSHWINIHSSYLALHRISHVELIQGLRQHIFGQDAALNLIGHHWQRSQVQLLQKKSVYLKLLFAGLEHVGKRTTAISIAQQLFGSTHMLYSAPRFSAQISTNTLTQMKVKRHINNRFVTLQEAVRQTPYAIIYFENIESIPAHLLSDMQTLLSTGLLVDDQGQSLDLRQTIIIASTTKGAHQLYQLAKSVTDEHESISDFKHLIMPSKQDLEPHAYFSPQQIVDDIATQLAEELPDVIIDHFAVIPFMPLTARVNEQILKLKITGLGLFLKKTHNIDLGFAPEVLTFLTQYKKKVKIGNKNDHLEIIDFDAAINQLYFTVEQALLTQPLNRKIKNLNYSQQLFLQLNETGLLLRASWLEVENYNHLSMI